MQKDINGRPSQGFTNSGKVKLWRFGRVLERKKNNSFQGELSSLVQTRKCTANRRWACTLLLQTTCYFVFFFQMLCRFFHADILLWRWDTLFGHLDCLSSRHLASKVYFLCTHIAFNLLRTKLVVKLHREKQFFLQGTEIRRWLWHCNGNF